MAKLNEKQKSIIRNFNVGTVATVNDDGTPAVSPKATFIIVTDSCIAFGDIRSPKTVSNLRKRPCTELNFVDILHREAVRIRGNATIVEKNSKEWEAFLPEFEKLWAPYVSLMKSFVVIDITHASLVKSPAYDVGLTREELRTTNLKKILKRCE